MRPGLVRGHGTRLAAGFVGLVVAVGTVGWAPASEARPADGCTESSTTSCQVDCTGSEGFRDDMADVIDWVERHFPDEQIDEVVPDDVPNVDPDRLVDDQDDEIRDFDPAGQPEWLRTEVLVHRECFLVGHDVAPPCDPDTPRESPGGLFPDHCWGSYPTPNYDVGYEGAANWYDVTDYGRAFAGSLLSLAFNIATMAMGLGLWIISWAFTFDIADLSEFSGTSAAKYQENLVGPLDLRDFAWFVLVFWAGFTALRGRAAAAGGEVLLSILLASLAAVLIRDVTSSDPEYLTALSDRVEELSNAVLLASTVDDPDELDEVEDGSMETALRPSQRALHEAFVEQPYDLLNWGELIKEGSTCDERRDNILSVGRGLDDEWARRYMGRDGSCSSLVAYNADPSKERWVGALFHMAVALVVMVFLGLTALSVVIAKFVVAAMFALAPFFVVAGILPGAGRRILWWWVGTVVQMVVVVVALSTLLSVMVIAVDNVLTMTATAPLVARWAIMVGVVAGVYLGRRGLLHSSQRLAGSVSDALLRMAPAVAGGGGGGGGGSPMGGFNLNRVDNPVLYGAGGALALPAQMAYTRYVERRVQMRSLENLKTMQRYQEKRDGLTGTMRTKWRQLPWNWRQGSRPRVAVRVGWRGKQRRQAFAEGRWATRALAQKSRDHKPAKLSAKWKL